jgi:hypothetical protein
MDDEELLKVGSLLNLRCMGGVPDLMQEELDYMLLWELNSEIDRGTFDQYLTVAAGDRVLDVAAALERLGSTQMVAVLNQVIGLLPGGWCEDLNERRIRVAAVPNGPAMFKALTQAYYDALEAEQTVSERMMGRIHDAYIRRGLI